MAWVDMPGCVNCGCGGGGGQCVICQLPDTFQLFTRLVEQGSDPIARDWVYKVRCRNGTEPVEMNRVPGQRLWLSGQQPDGTSYTVSQDDITPDCVSLSGVSYCSTTASVECLASSGGPLCPYGDTPDPGTPKDAQWCVSCTGDVSWYGSGNLTPGVGFPCCNPAQPEQFIFGCFSTSTGASPLVADCCCRGVNLLSQNRVVSVRVTGCATQPLGYSWTSPLLLVHYAPFVWWANFEDVDNDGQDTRDFFYIWCDASTGETKFRYERWDINGQVFRVEASTIEVLSCDPFMASVSVSIPCRPCNEGPPCGGFVNLEISVSQ